MERLLGLSYYFFLNEMTRNSPALVEKKKTLCSGKYCTCVALVSERISCSSTVHF